MGTKLHSASTLAEIKTAATYEIDEERRQFRNQSRALRELKVKKSKDPMKARERDGDDGWEVLDDVSLRVNYDKYNVLIRNELLIKAAEDRWNRAAGTVMRAVLAASLEFQTEPKEIRTEHAVGVTAIVAQIPTSAHKLLVAGIAGQSSKSIPEIVRQYLAVMSGDDLAADVTGARFLTHTDHSSPSYFVEIENICTSLKASLLTELVRDRIDEKAARVLAVVARAHFASETMVRFMLL